MMHPHGPPEGLEPRSLGRTGLSVTPMGLGLAALGRPAYVNLGHHDDVGERRTPAALERHAHRVLDCAWDAGWRYFDAARSYGLAERFLASWFTARPERAAAATVGSKWGYAYTAGWRADADVHEVKDHSVGQLRRQLAESRQELGDLLRLYQVHSATCDSGVLDDPAVLAALVTLADSGVVVGLTTSGADQATTIRRALEAEVLAHAAREAAPLASDVTVYDPVPAPMPRLAGRHRAQLLVQSSSRRTLQRFLAAWHPRLGRGRASAVRWALDVDPIEL